MENFLIGLQNFKLEMFGSVLISAYLAWFLWAIIGGFIATNVRNHLTSLKNYPINVPQILVGLLITFAFIRFSLELTGLVPNAFGAFLIGLSGNEAALAAIRKYLDSKKVKVDVNDVQAFDEPIRGGGDKNDPSTKP